MVKHLFQNYQFTLEVNYAETYIFDFVICNDVFDGNLTKWSLLDICKQLINYICMYIMKRCNKQGFSVQEIKNCDLL